MNALPKDWAKGYFRAIKGKKNWQVVCPAGECVDLGFSADEKQDQCQAEFLAQAGNIGLMASSRKRLSPEMEKFCPYCEGKGEVTVVDSQHGHYGDTFPCPKCSTPVCGPTQPCEGVAGCADGERADRGNDCRWRRSDC